MMAMYPQQYLMFQQPDITDMLLRGHERLMLTQYKVKQLYN